MTRSMIYRGGLTREQFLFYEMRIAARYYQRAIPVDDAVAEITAENLFQFPTEREVRSIARACYRRLEALNNAALVQELIDAPSDIAKQINLYAIMRDNRLVWEFMVDLIGEKYRQLDFSLTRQDINTFMTHLQAENDTIAAWSESTIKKIKSVLVRCLVETGYLESHRDTTLHPVFLDDALLEGIRANNDKPALAAFNYFE